MKNSVYRLIKEKELIREGENILIGFSGGPDSLALMDILVSLKDEFNINISAAHLNHGIRNTADEEVETIREMCAGYKVPLFVAKRDILSLSVKQGKSTEEAGRDYRYQFFFRLAGKYGFHKIALGHHQNDQMETMLLRMIRGTGVYGLMGMQPLREDGLIRPLLNTSRNEIEAYCKNKGLSPVIDITNDDVAYHRNKVRHEIVPIAQEINPGALKHFSQLAEIAKAYENFLDDYIQPKIKEIMTEGNRNVSWNIEKLKLEKPVVQQKILRSGIEKLKTDLKEIQYHHILECIRRINEEKNTTWDYHLPGDYLIIRRYQRLIITKKNHMSAEKSVLYPLLPKKEYYIPYLRICVKCYEADVSEMPAEKEGMWNNACFDLDKVTFPLMIRNRRTGDAYSPKGFAGHKKIKKEMINRKIPKEERCHIPILCDSKGLIWMIPSGKDEKYLISNRTGRILVIKYKYYG